MDISILYSSQASLDQFVRTNLGISEKEFNSTEMVDKRVFALKVELAEFSNETAWFKYWKTSHKMDLAKVLEELADVMHFFLSVGISRNYHTFIPRLEPEKWLQQPQEHLYRSIMENNIGSAGHWKNAFEQLIALGLMLGFEKEQMVLAYHLKNQKNIERQLNKY